jgi:hypothetical protein
MSKRLASILFLFFLAAAAFAQSPQWSPKAAREWYARQPWMVGCNYIPANAINQLEMWNADTFDADRINMELGWAQSVGLNTLRVFLHDQLWDQGWSFQRRMEHFLKLADDHNMRVIFVLFDSCWDPFPEDAVKQRAPKPGVHNSGWVQSPGATALMDPRQEQHLLDYVQLVVRAFAKDKRVLAWDLWNEPDNLNDGSYGSEEPKGKVERVLEMLPRVYQYARAALPTQPLTSGVWKGDWSSADKLSPMERIQLEQSDVISFHSYDPPEEFEKRIKWLEAYHRPIFCTEYMARPRGSTFQAILPIAKKYGVAAFNWGLVNGKTQTNLPWDSWQHPYTGDAPVWFHDIFTYEGQLYQPEEGAFLRQITAPAPKIKAKAKKAKAAAATP